MYPTLYHTFKGFVKGLSSFHVNPVDVRKVINMDYRKRLFCINDTEYKYSLEIEYYDPRSELSVTYIRSASGHVETRFYNHYEETSEMTLRYKTEKEIINEINEIKKKQNLISEYDNQQNLKLEEFVKSIKY